MPIPSGAALSPQFGNPLELDARAVRPTRLLLTGGTGFLGSHFLLWRLRAGGQVFVLVRGKSVAEARARLLESLAQSAASYDVPVPIEAFEQNVHCLVGDITLPRCGLSPEDQAKLTEAKLDEVWHSAASLAYENRHRTKIHAHNCVGTRNVLDVALRSGVGRFIYVSTAYTAGTRRGLIAEELHPVPPDGAAAFNNYYEESKAEAERDVSRTCTEAGLAYSIVRPSVIVGPSGSRRSGGTRFGLYGFVHELHRLREGLAQVTDPLRVLGDKGAVINLVPVDHVVLDMLRLSATGFEGGPVHHLVGPEEVAAEGMIDRVSRALQLSILSFTTRRETEASPIEQLFDLRGAFYASYGKNPKRFARALPPHPPLTLADLEVYLSSFLAELARESTGDVFTPVQVRARDGVEVCAFTRGDPSRPVLVLCNAYAMPEEFLAPLAQRLSQRWRVITWNTRWLPTPTPDFNPDRCDSSVHVEDLTAILDRLEIPRVEAVVGWSSGAQVALRALAEHPARFARGVLLNGTVSLPADAGPPMTSFEKNLRRLFPQIAANPSVAERYCKLIFGNASAGGAPQSEDRKIVASVLTSTDPHLLYMTSVPFRTPASLFRYAHMVSALFREREDAWTTSVKQPVLVYGGGADLISHPDQVAALASRLVDARTVLNPTADHFSHFYDEGIATMIEDFAQNAPPLAAPPEPATEGFARTLERLIHLSNADPSNPFRDLVWEKSLPQDQYWMSPELLSVHGTPWEKKLTPEQLLLLSKWECINFFSLNVTGIRELLTEMISRIHTPGHEVSSEYLHHLVLEENEHMWYFSRFCLTYGGKIYKDRRIRYDNFPESDIKEFLAFATVLVFEEIVDIYNSQMAKDAGLPPFVREINRLHHSDETRHISYGRLNIERLHQDLRTRYGVERLREVERALKRFMLMSMQKLYNPEIYKDAGLPEPLKLRNELLAHPERIAFNERILSKTVRFLVKKEIFSDDRLS
ncbi:MULTISPECIES: alpha/beta fold hydrolase [Corallococcus]|uniref:alpha/beta fold hydrolase n=1 Tax=Corallococcus TaxID=83461 RepID=UPI00117DF03F|nr:MULTISPECIES: alpha/beta fold hydrolase [Corallococcus]TSC34277.1 alpha/beta fold hydrolase [Corallococcus sp. Z5C101001]